MSLNRITNIESLSNFLQQIQPTGTSNSILRESNTALANSRNGVPGSGTPPSGIPAKQPTNIVVTVGGTTVNGYLAEEGLQLRLNNKYEKLFGDGNIFTTTSKMIKQADAMGITSLAGIKENLEKMAHYVMNLRSGENFGSSADLTAPGMVINSPMFWTGTEPLDLSIKFFQIARSEGEVMDYYYNMLRDGSPEVNDAEAVVTRVDYPRTIVVEVYGLSFSEVLLQSLTCTVKGPFDKAGSPVVGEYDMQFKSSKMVDKKRIDEIFTKNAIKNPFIVTFGK